MSSLHYQNQSLHMEAVPLSAIAKAVGTPVYVYSKQAILHNLQTYTQAFKATPHQLCYAVKANGNLSILKCLADAGAGFDVVSIGELHRVIAAGGDPQKTVFSGVGKTEAELREAISLSIYCIDVESEPECERLAHIAETLNQSVNIAIRVNPNIDAKTHAHISTGLSSNKFGIDSAAVLPLAKHLQTKTHLKLIGLAAHIGSQITDIQPLLTSAEHLIALATALQAFNIHIKHINIGGGLGIQYQNETPPSVQAYADAIHQRFKNTHYSLILEPGRAIIGNAGCLLTQIEYLKTTPQKEFAVINAGMNDLIRPTLYDAWQRILPVIQKNAPEKTYDIAGPVCESADFLGKDRKLAIASGDLLAIDCAGAYGFSMSSNYNARCRPAEVLVDGDRFKIIRQRETIEECLNNERMCLES
jgi:diaminopimelate decarboxylase